MIKGFDFFRKIPTVAIITGAVLILFSLIFTLEVNETIKTDFSIQKFCSGLIILFLIYALIFTDIKKNESTTKVVMIIEMIFFVFIAFIGFIIAAFPNVNSVLIENEGFWIGLIFAIHGFIGLLLNYLVKVVSLFFYLFYIALFGLGIYFCASDLSDVIPWIVIVVLILIGTLIILVGISELAKKKNKQSKKEKINKGE